VTEIYHLHVSVLCPDKSLSVYVARYVYD